MLNYLICGFIIFVICYIAVIQYEKCPPFCMVVVYNRLSYKPSIVKIKEGKGTFIIPFVQGCLVLPADSITKSLTLYNIRTQDSKYVTISLVYTFLFSKNKEIFQKAVDKLQGYSMGRISELIEFIVEREIMNKVSVLKFSDVYSGKTFLQASKNNIEFELNEIGIDLIELIVEKITEGQNLRKPK